MSDYPFDEYICGVTGLTCCGCSLFCEHRRERMINDKNALPVLTKKQIEQINKKQPSKEFTESCKKASKLFGINKTKINLKIEEIEELINSIGWDNWDLREGLNCRLLELKELIEQEK